MPNNAAGICYRVGDSVLLLLRAATSDHALTWGFPGGGIEEGETPEQAAIRESVEETGYAPAAPLRMLDWCDGFTTFLVKLPLPFVPTLNGEHVGYAWVPLSSLPHPMHPGCETTLLRPTVAMDARRVVDGNGWFEVKANPISKVGIFPYSGRQLGLDTDEIFQVLRPPEELGAPECVESFKLLPWIDEHVMMGPEAQKITSSAVPAEAKGVQGVIGEDVFFQEGTLFANLKAFSSTLASLISAGKRELSAGYRCVYDMTAGVWNGQAYDAVQRKIRGNHIALVKEGRMGPDVAVMDRFTFTFDTAEIQDMADETEGGGEMTLADITAAIKQILPAISQIAEIQKTLAALSAPPAPVEDKEAAPVEDAPAMDESSVIKRIAARTKLASQLETHLGVFDHAEKTLAEIVAYGCEKLGIKADKGSEAAVLSGYLQAKPITTPSATVALDSAAPKVGSFISKHLKTEG